MFIDVDTTPVKNCDFIFDKEMDFFVTPYLKNFFIAR